MATIEKYLNRPAAEIKQWPGANLHLLEFSKVIDYRRKIVFITAVGPVDYMKADNSLESAKFPLPAKRRGPKPKNPDGAKWKATFHLSRQSQKCLIAEAKQATTDGAKLSYGEIIDAALKASHPKHYIEEGKA